MRSILQYVGVKCDELFIGPSKRYRTLKWLCVFCMHALDSEEVNVDINFAVGKKNFCWNKNCVLLFSGNIFIYFWN